MCICSLVYDPKSGTNEEDSEALFTSFSEAAGLKPPDSRTVSGYIIATKRHDSSASDDHDLRAFIDLDMAVVGRERSAYLAYASQVGQKLSGKIRHRYFVFKPMLIYHRPSLSFSRRDSHFVWLGTTALLNVPMYTVQAVFPPPMFISSFGSEV